MYYLNETNITKTYTIMKKHFLCTVKKFFAPALIAFAVAAMTIFVSCKKEENNNDPDNPTTVAVTGVSLTTTSATLTLGAASSVTTLTATIAPGNATNKAVAWTTSSTAVATVSSGTSSVATITAVAPGAATITVTTQDGSHTATCAITVNAAPGSDTEMNMKDFGTNTGITYKSVSSGAELADYWSSITTAGNYVINTTGSLGGIPGLDLADIYPGSGIIISLRGTSNNITLSEDIELDNGETLILRDVNIVFTSDNVSCTDGSKFIMEAGSAILGSGVGVYDGGTFTMNGGKIHSGDGVYVENDGAFIMNGGEIYGNTGYYGGGVSIRGKNARFEKKPGGRIYNNTGEAGYGHQVIVGGYDEYSYYPFCLAYRDTEVTTAETLAITINAAGNGIASETGTWVKDIPAGAVNISGKTVSQIESAIRDEFNRGKVAITVSGTLTGVTNSLGLEIPAGRTVTWEANYTGNSGVYIYGSSSSGENFGAGDLVIAPGGRITSNGDVISVQSGRIIVKGIVTATNNTGIFSHGGTIIVDGGTITANSNAINAYDTTKVTIQSGVVTTTGNAPAIDLQGNAKVTIQSGTVTTAGDAAAISVGGNSKLAILGGSISATASTQGIVWASYGTSIIYVAGGAIADGGIWQNWDKPAKGYYAAGFAGKFRQEEEDQYSFTIGVDLFAGKPDEQWW